MKRVDRPTDRIQAVFGIFYAFRGLEVGQGESRGRGQAKWGQSHSVPHEMEPMRPLDDGYGYAPSSRREVIYNMRPEEDDSHVRVRPPTPYQFPFDRIEV